MAGASSPRSDDNDCLRLPATSSPRIRGAEKKESTGLRLNQPCPPYVTPSSTSSIGRSLSSAHIAESKSLKNSGEDTFCQSSANTSLFVHRSPSIDPELMIRLNAYCAILESATAYRSPCARVENPVGRSLWRPWNALTTGRTFLTSHFPEYFEQVSYDLI